jgi:hypothetical protein
MSGAAISHAPLVNTIWASLDMPGEAAVYKLEQYRPAGVKVFFVTNRSNPYLFGWDGAEEYRYDDYEGELTKLSRRLPDIRFILTVGARPGAPFRWCQEHEDQLAQLPDGTKLHTPSLASALWREQSVEALRRLVAHFEASRFADRIIGYTPVFSSHQWRGVGECPADIPTREVPIQFGDYSAPMRDGFRTRTGLELPTKEERETVGGDNLFGFLEERGTKLVEYFRYYNELNATLALAYCRAVKEACGGRKLVGLMHGFLFGWPNATSYPQGSGHGAAKLLLESEWIDFFHAPYSSYHRSLAGAALSQLPVESVRARGKRFVAQLDCGTHAKRLAERNITTLIGTGSLEQTFTGGTVGTAWESEQLLTRDVGATLVKGGTPYWQDYKEPVFGHWFLFRPGGPMTYDLPELQATMARLGQWAATMPPAESVSEVAVVSSAESCYYRKLERSFGNYFVEGLRNWVLPFTGAPCDEYLLEDFAAIPRRYKVYVFLDTGYVPGALREQIRAKLAADGATAVWFYAPGYVDERGPAVANCAALTGIRMAKRNEKRALQVRLADGTEFGSQANDFQRDMHRAEWPKENQFSPVFFADDAGAESRGTLTGTDACGYAVKQVGAFRSVYFAAPLPPVAVLRGLFAEAGVHLYCAAGDTVYANRRLVVFCAHSDGAKVLRWPEREIRFVARAGETKLIEVP